MSQSSEAMKWGIRKKPLVLLFSLLLVTVPPVLGGILPLSTTLGPQTAVMTQLILLSELIYNVEASDDPNLMARPFCPAVRWKTL